MAALLEVSCCCPNHYIPGVIGLCFPELVIQPQPRLGGIIVCSPPVQVL